MDRVWIFNGSNARFPSGVFTTLERAEEWIGRNRLTGILTLYPVEQGVYDWALANKLFHARNDKEKSSDFIEKFTSASMEHFHYENGTRE